jgi:hypothetical protein
MGTSAPTGDQFICIDGDSIAELALPSIEVIRSVTMTVLLTGPTLTSG